MGFRFNDIDRSLMIVLISAMLPCVILIVLYLLINALLGPHYPGKIWAASLEIGKYYNLVFIQVRLIHFLVISLLISAIGGVFCKPRMILYQPVVFLTFSIFWYLFELYDNMYYTNIGWAFIDPLEEAIVCLCYTIASIPSSVILHRTGLRSFRLSEREEKLSLAKKKKITRYW